MANLSKESIKKLRAVKAAILAQPEFYDQSKFAGKTDPCGTACCIAGWAVWNEDPEKFLALAIEDSVDGGVDCVEEAYSALGIVDSWCISMNLFMNGKHWPPKFSYLWEKSRSRVEKSIIAADRIEHFISTDGLE